MTSATSSESASPLPPEESYLSLRDGERLTPDIAESIFRTDETRVVALVGPKDAGKTSIIACLSELFQRGRLGSLTFAGSGTLRAFEKACHQARAASRRVVPDTERTSQREGLGFFHLRFAAERSGFRSLLIADRAGESYRQITDNLDNANGLTEVARADVVNLLIDGSRLSDINRRHQLRSETIGIIAALVESGLTRSSQRLALVVTKYDETDRVQDQARVSRDLDRLLKLLQTYGASFRSSQTFLTAASPTGGHIPRGYGLEAVAEYWMEPTDRHALAAPGDGLLSASANGSRIARGRMFWELSAQHSEIRRP